MVHGAVAVDAAAVHLTIGLGELTERRRRRLVTCTQDGAGTACPGGYYSASGRYSASACNAGCDTGCTTEWGTTTCTTGCNADCNTCNGCTACAECAGGGRVGCGGTSAGYCVYPTPKPTQRPTMPLPTPEAFPATCPAWYDESAYQYPFYYQDDPGADDLPNDVGSIQDGFSVYNGRFTSKFVGMAALAATNLAGDVEICAVVTPLCVASCVKPTLSPAVEERWREWCPGAVGYDLTDNQKIVALVSGACGGTETDMSFFSNPEIFYGGGFHDADGNDVLPAGHVPPRAQGAGS